MRNKRSCEANALDASSSWTATRGVLDIIHLDNSNIVAVLSRDNYTIFRLFRGAMAVLRVEHKSRCQKACIVAGIYTASDRYGRWKLASSLVIYVVRRPIAFSFSFAGHDSRDDLRSAREGRRSAAQTDCSRSQKTQSRYLCVTRFA